MNLGPFHAVYYLSAALLPAGNPFVLTDARIEINGVNYSSVFRKVTLAASVDFIDATILGDTWRSRNVTLVDWSATFEGLCDLTTIDAAAFAALGTAATCKIRPISAAITATNPEYNGPGLLDSFSTFGTAVGEIAPVMLAVKGTAPLVRSTS